MTEALKPKCGGFMRPFGCGEFIKDFLLGRGPNGSPKIDPEVGAPQSDMHYAYKKALHHSYAEDMVATEEEKRMRKGLPAFTVQEAEERTAYYLKLIPYKLTHCRYHSFVVYFSNLQRLGWVEFTGKEEPSEFQEHHPPGPPRKYFRLTTKGKAASDAEWANPLFALYGDRWSREHLQEIRKKHKYTTKTKR